MRFRVPMRCPVCMNPMRAMDSKEERHVDPSGHGVYVCMHGGCPGAGNEPLVYRRVLRGVQQRQESIATATEQTRATQLQDHRVQTERVNELTIWLRSHYPGYLQGQFKDVIDIAIFVMSHGKDDRRLEKGGGPDAEQ
jgi:hypothetical protein